MSNRKKNTTWQKRISFMIVLISFNYIMLQAQWSFVGSAITSNTETIDNLVSDNSGNVYACRTGDSLIYKWDGSSWTKIKPASIFTNVFDSNLGALYCDTSTNHLYATLTIEDTTLTINNYLMYYNGNQWQVITSLNSILVGGLVNVICKDLQGNLYVAGGFANSSGKCYVAKWSGSSWSEVGGLNALAANNVINSICCDNAGNLYASGNFKGSNGKPYVAKWNGSSWGSLGDIYAGINTATVTAGGIFPLHIDVSGNLYAGAFAITSITITPHAFPFISKWNGQQWTLLPNSSYTVINASNVFFSITSDKLGNVYAAGPRISPNGNFDVLKWNGNTWQDLRGNLNGNCGNPTGYVSSICLDSYGSLYGTGNIYDASCFPLVAKYSSPWLASITEQTSAEDDIAVFPNPANEILNFNSVKLHENMYLELTNSLGQIVLKRNNFDIAQNIDISGLKSGVYFLRLDDNKSQRVFKIVKN